MQNSAGDSSNNQTTTNSSEISSIRFSKEQIEQRYKLLTPSSTIAQTNNSNLGTGSLAHKDTFLIDLSATSRKNEVRIIDSSSLDHITGSRELFSKFLPSFGHQKIKIADGSLNQLLAKEQ